MSWEDLSSAKRIKAWHETGRIFSTTPELEWLFRGLALADTAKFPNGSRLKSVHWMDEVALQDLVHSSVWGSLSSNHEYLDELVK